MAYRTLRGQEITLTISRDGLATPWGFRLQGGVDFQSPLIVQKVVPTGAADEILQCGDIVVKINEVDALRLKHEQALNCIAASGSSLKLTILRGATSAQQSGGSACRTTSRDTTPIQNSVENGTSKPPKLADIMKESLQLKEQGQLHTIQTQRFRGTPISRTQPKADLSSYLPSPPPKKPVVRFQDTPLIVRTNSREVFSPTSSGRSSPSSSTTIEMGDPNGPKSMGVWVPPVHQPNAKLVHLQYNTPMNLYSARNVADSVEKMTGTKIEWLNQKQPSTRYLDDIRESPTYKFVQELEGRAPRARSVEYQQSNTIKRLNRYLRLE